MIGVMTSSDRPIQPNNGLRPISLRTDLTPLIDLLEIVFYDSMDTSDRAIIQEMRYFSKIGGAFSAFGRLNELLIGVRQGFVWIEDGKLVGNVSIVPAGWPHDLGSAWQIVNVGVHPDYQRRGIAYQLMKASMDLIQQHGGKHAILQVAYENTPAIRLYERLGFHKERAFTNWERNSIASAPLPHTYTNFQVMKSQRRDWHQEYILAQAARPNHRGGIGWLQPVHKGAFHQSIWQQITHLFSLNSIQHLVVRPPQQTDIQAALWIEQSLAFSHTKLTLINQENEDAAYIDALLTTALRQHRNTGFIIDHPHDDQQTSDLLTSHRFHAKRTRWHMRWSF